MLKVMQGPDLKEQDAEFMISNGGVVDIEGTDYYYYYS